MEKLALLQSHIKDNLLSYIKNNVQSCIKNDLHSYTMHVVGALMSF